MVQVRTWDPVEARELLPEDLCGWRVEGEHWLWLGRVNNSGYAVTGCGNAAAKLVFSLLALRQDRPVWRDRILEHRCEFKHCVYPGHKFYQNAMAFERKWVNKRWGRKSPESQGRGCAHEGACRVHGCDLCLGVLRKPHERLPAWVTGEFVDDLSGRSW